MLKFFHYPSMQAQKQLFKTLVKYWKPNQEAFVMDDEVLQIDTKDIYFLTCLSQ